MRETYVQWENWRLSHYIGTHLLSSCQTRRYFKSYISDGVDSVTEGVYNSLMETRVDRSRVKLTKLGDAQTNYVPGTPEERIGFVWELTRELWSLKDPQIAEQRLQRNVTNLIRPRG